MRLTKNDWFGAGRGMGLKLELGLGLGLCLLWMALGSLAGAQAVSTTTVQGTVYLASGQVGSGTLVLSWPAFTTASGQSVAADSMTVTIAPDGFISVNLAPNQGATPAGLYYTAVYYLSDGTTTTQYWVVPAAAQASLAQVQAQLMPAAQAVQAVSKSYVDQEFAELEGSLLLATGGSLTGPLNLSGDPTQPLQAADKHYVDAEFALAVPLAGGNMTGALQTPAVNGVQSPAAGSAQTPLQAAMNAAGTKGAMEIPPTYTGTDGFTNPNGLYVKDLRPTGAQQTERSVKEFGAVCDGVTDDTNALQSALTYAHAHGVTLTIPQGTCKTRSLNWEGESIGGLGKQVSALMGFPGQDVLASTTDSVNMLSNTRIHDVTIYVDQSVDVSCSPAEGRASAGSCAGSRLMEKNSIFSPGGNGLTGATGMGAGWAVGNCAIAMPAATGAGGNGLHVAEMENVEIAATGVDPMAAQLQYSGARSTHTCGLYLAQWPQWSEFRNIDIRGVNTGIAIPALPVTTPAGLNSDSNRWQNITINATHAFTAAAGSNNVLDNVVAMVGSSAATAEPPTGLVLDLSGTEQGWTVRNAVVLPTWNAVQPQLVVTASGGAVTGVTVGSEHGLGFDPYGTQVPIAFSGSCTAQATAAVNTNGSIGTVSVAQGGVGCSGTTTASVNVAGTWDTAAPVNLIGGQEMTLFAGNLLKGNGGYTVWNATSSQSNGTQMDGGGGNLPGGGTYAALVANSALGTALQADQFPGADIGAKIQTCLGALSATYGGTCDARNFTGSLSMGSNLTISTANAAVLLPCATIATANQVVVTAGTRNVSLRGCALLGGSAASGSQGGTAFLYSGTSAMVQVGDPTYAVDTPGFHMDNVAINTTATGSATAQGLAAYRTQEMNLENLYFLGNSNQTGMTLDGTGNYTGGSFFSNHFSGFQTAVNAIGHQVANAATTDWLNASTFVRLHIDCPTSNGNPIAGTYGINLQQGDGNTFTGGDVEGCNTALHLGPNAQNNTITGLRNENSNNQVVADAGSAYNNWITGGTMFTGQLTDNGTRNSFLDTFHRSFNGLNGDWYGSQKDTTLTNHYRLGIGAGNERGLLNEIQTDYGYRWIEGYSDATAGEQFYQVEDLLNSVNRVSIGQYNNGQSSTNNQTVINAAGTGAVVLNGSANAGTGGVVIGSGGAGESTVATISNAGNAQFNGTLQVGGTSQSTGTMTVRNNADAEVDYYLWPGLTTSQKGSYTYKDWNGNSQWYMVKDASNNWALNSALGGLDSFKAYQSTNSGDTYVNASNSSGFVRVNYESGSGTGFNVYGGSSSTLYASFTGTTSIKFPGLAASSGHFCLQVDTSGYLTNTGAACGSGSGGGSGTVGSGNSGQIAYYTATGTTVGGISQVPVSAGGTGASTSGGALTNLGAQAAIPGLNSDGANGIAVTGNVTAANTVAYGSVTGAKIGPVLQCDQFSGADVSIKANACNAAVIAAGGGTIDLRTLLAGNTTGSQEIEFGSRAANNNGIGVTAIVPTSGNYTFSQVGAPILQASLSSGGSGYTANAACTVIPQETGFAYTGKATGGVITVTANGSGVITSVTATPTSAGSGYLTSKYVTVTNGGSNPCTGSGLILNIQAQDCGIRLNGSSAIESGSVGAGATTFMIRPSASNTGFVAEASLCTDQAGGYERTDGGIKTYDGSGATYNPGTGAITGGPWLTAATTLIQDVVDQSQFNLLETSATHGNGLWIDGACCGVNFYSPHADNGNNNYTGYPIIVGSGGIIQNACYANGSTTVTAPYAHFTAKYLGFVLNAGTSSVSSVFPSGTVITAVNSLTNITVSQGATGPGNNTNALCMETPLTSPVPSTSGTGLTIALSDPTAPNNWAISIYNPVANDPGPGLENMLFNYGDQVVNVYGSYEEPNLAIDEYTAINYIAAQTYDVNFYGPFGGSEDSKYFVQADTNYDWSVNNGNIGAVGIKDQGVVHTPQIQGGQFTYVKGGLSFAANGANLLPDTNLKQGTTYWTLPNGVSIAGGIGPLGDNGFSYTLSGTSSGNILIFAPVAIANLQANSYYTMGIQANLTNVTSGNLYLYLCATVSTSSCGTPIATSTNFAYNSRTTPGVFSTLFNTGSFTGGYFAIGIANVAGSGTLTISEPFLVAGNIPIYQENDGGAGSAPSQGIKALSLSSPTITLNGGTPWTSSSSANPQVVTCPSGGTNGQVCGAQGAWFTPASGIPTCADTSGSGTAQSCTPSSTVTACMAYTTTTANSGSSLTINVGGGGALPVGKGLGATTSLTAGDLPANTLALICPNVAGAATQWNLVTVGNLSSGAGTITGVTAGTGLSGGGTSGTVTVSLSTPVAVANGGTGAATAGANTVFGNFTGLVAAPGFTAAPAFSAANLTNFPSTLATYPGAGVPNSTGSAWGTSYTVGTGSSNLVQLNSSSQLPAVSGANLTALNGSNIASGSVGASYLPSATSSSLGIVKPDGVTTSVSSGALTAQRVAWGGCTGTATSSATLLLWGLGSAATACTGASTSQPLAPMMPTAGTASGLSVRCLTTGVNSSSGVFVLWDYNTSGASTNTGLTAAYGSSTAGSEQRDTTHTYAYSAGDILFVKFTTQASETLGNCNVSFNY